MRRYMMVGLGLLLGIAVAWAGDAATLPTQLATAASSQPALITTKQSSQTFADQEHMLRGIMPEGFRTVVQSHRDRETGICTLRASGAILQAELKLDSRKFKFLDVWHYDPGTKDWHKLERPAPKTVAIVADHKRTVFGSHTDQILIELSDKTGLYWVRWLEDDTLLQMPVLCGPVMPQDYHVAPPPKGMVVAGIPYEDHAEVTYIADPGEFFSANPPATTRPATAPATKPGG